MSPGFLNSLITSLRHFRCRGIESFLGGWVEFSAQDTGSTAQGRAPASEPASFGLSANLSDTNRLMIHWIRILLVALIAAAPTAAQNFGPPGSGEDSFGGDPVEIGAVTFEPSSVAPGGDAVMVVEIMMAPGWHIYSVLEASGQTPTTIEIKTEGLTAAGAIVQPDPVEDHGQTYHEGTFKLRLPVKVAAAASGKLRVKAELGYMACNAKGCRPPEAKTLRANLEVKAADSGGAAGVGDAGDGDFVRSGALKTDQGHLSFEVRAKAADFRPGGELVVELKGRVVEKRWTYSATKPVGYAKPSVLEFATSPHFAPAEKHEESEATLKKAKEEWDQDSWIHEGEFTIRRRLKLADELPSRLAIEGFFDGQTCDEGGCVNFKTPFRLVFAPKPAAGEGGAGIGAAGLKAIIDAVEGVHGRLDDLEDSIATLTPKAAAKAPPAPTWGIEDVKVELQGEPRAGETTPIVMTFRTPEKAEIGPVANLFVDFNSRRVQNVEALAAESSENGLEHKVTLELKATDVAQSGDETLELDFSVPLLVGGYEYDFESTGHEIAATYGLPNLWDWVLRSIFAALLALLTPCVFPMIPVTVSYFTKQAEAGGGSGLFLPVVYALGIIISFVVIGVGFTLVAGAAGANVLATNGYVQFAFGLLFVLFALSLFGVYDLRPPAFLMSKAGSVQGKGGLVGVLGMGLLFALTTFTCTAPLVGLILVAAAETGEWVLPIIGMFAFASTLALPFFILALFPKLMSGLPKSGGWLGKVKVTLGFLEMAFAFKFFGAMDAYFGWGIFTRELILWIWVVLFILNGLYLLGLIRFDKYEEFAPAGPIIGAISVMLLIFGIYLVQGAQGKKMPYLVESLMPPAEVTGGDGLGWASHGLYKNDLEKAVAEAKERGVGLFIDFTGYT